MKKLYLFFLAALFAASPIPAWSQSITTSPLVATPFAQLPCPVLNQGIAFSCQLTATGGVATGGVYTWSNTGALPTGLTLTSGGLLSGTPSSSSAFPVTFNATDSPAGGNSQSSISITLQANALTGTGPCSAAICVGTGIGSVNTSSTLQLQALAYFSGGLTGFNTVDITSLSSWTCTTGSGCTGSSINASGLFSSGSTAGSATANASFGGVNGSSSLTVVSTTPPLIITYPTVASGLPNGQINQLYSEGSAGNSTGQGVQLVVANGTPPYTWTVSAGGPLPTGLTLSSGGLISGTATASGAGVTTTFKVTDSASNTQTVIISGGITIGSLSSLVVNLAQSSIPANTSTTASSVGTYSDSSTAPQFNAGGGAAFVQKQIGTICCNGGSPTVTTLATPAMKTTTANMLTVFQFAFPCSSYSVPTDTAGNTYTSTVSIVGCVQQFNTFNITGNAANVTTCNFATATHSALCLVMEHTGVLAAPLDQHPAATSGSTGTSCTPNSVTTTQANELAIEACIPAAATSYTLPSGFTSRDSNSLTWDISDAVYTAIQTGITPATVYSPSGATPVTFLATYKGNSSLTGGIMWSSATPSVATISPNGVITCQSVSVSSTSVITGNVGATSNTATVTCTPANQNQDTGIVVSPSTAFVALGGNQQFNALGNVTGNTYAAAWGSSNTAVASVNATSGLANCATAGTVTISAAVTGFTSASATLTCQTTSGQVINVPTCNASDLGNPAVGLPDATHVTSPTVTVNIPSGSCTYTTQVSYAIPSSITSLIIHGNTTVSCNDATAGTSSFACTATDNTVLIDSFITNGQSIWSISTGNATLRVTGITFQGGTFTNTSTKPNGFVILSGSQNFRFDHCHFNPSTYTNTSSNPHNVGGGLTIFSQMPGVVDHSIFNLVAQNNAIRNYPDTYGDIPASQPTALGTSNFIFGELDIFMGGFANDCDRGGREVIRYSTISADPNDAAGDSGAIQTHAISQGVPRFRGCRVLEKYHNYFSNPTPSTLQYTAGDGNSSTGISWGNTIGTGYSFDIAFESTRVKAGNNCGGTNCPAPPNSFGYCGTGSNGLSSSWDGNTNSQGYPCIGQTGRGQGDLLNNAAFPNVLDTATGTATWPHELREPWYVWNETIASTNVCTNQTLSGTTAQPNQAFYCQVSASPNSSPTSPFNGTTGTGFGPLANRPTTCTAGPGGTFDTSPTGSYGVAYFATDMNGGNGGLFVCTATNVWTQIYQPYTFPHPLDH